jgi:alkylated DNA nucleotide flippase Atl1
VRPAVCIYGAIAGMLGGTAYASYVGFKMSSLPTFEWLAFVGVTVVAGAILSGAGSGLWNCIVRRQ